MTDAAKFEPCDRTAPKKDQTAPLANRPRSESATHITLNALVAPFHDLMSVGIKSNWLASDIDFYQRSPARILR